MQGRQFRAASVFQLHHPSIPPALQYPCSAIPLLCHCFDVIIAINWFEGIVKNKSNRVQSIVACSYICVYIQLRQSSGDTRQSCELSDISAVCVKDSELLVCWKLVRTNRVL